MIMKLGLWLELQKNVFESFPTLCNYHIASDVDLFEEKEILSFNFCRIWKTVLGIIFLFLVLITSGVNG
jgi:hypothetical protein